MSDFLKKARHSLSHILAQAVQREFGTDIKLWVWPEIKNWFYYDFLIKDPQIKIQEENLKSINKNMEQIIKQKQDFYCISTDLQKAKEINIFLWQELKNELIEDFEKEWINNITYFLNLIPMKAKESLLKWTNENYIKYYEAVNDFFQTNWYIWKDKFISFIDMCEWPHINNTQDLDSKSFKISKIAGAYWKWDEKNFMMTRVYWYAFEDKEKLKEYLNFLEEAKKRDHRVLGKKLDLFCFSDLVWPGLPMFTPRWTKIINLLQEKVENICSKYGFEKVITPHLAKIDLFKISGHADKYPEELFSVKSQRKQEYALKPVQCPHQTQIYASKKRSYKDLPIRYMESNKQYRAEQPWEISWLSRVVAITVEDWHVFCTVDQVKQEVMAMVNIIKDFFVDLGLRWNHWVSLSVRDMENLDKYIWEEEDRQICEKMLWEIAEEMNLWAIKCEWEAAVYGPKLDFMFKDSLGREIQIPTVQLDFATPKKFNLKYVDKDASEKAPVMIHRAILWSYERLLVILIEHFAWAFPFWLAPEQIKIIPVSDKFIDYCNKINNELIKYWFRSKINLDDDSFAKKIRNWEIQKIPFLLIVWEKEIQNNTINLRDVYNKQQYEINISDLIKKFDELN